MGNLQPSTPWDSDRGAEIWAQLPAEQQAQQLDKNDALIWAALGVKLVANGNAVRTQNWREIKAGQR